MNISDKIKNLKAIDLNCNVFDVYSYDGLSMQELLCQFFTKINECIKVSNETVDLASWLVNEGLKQEVANKLVLWLNDGTLENIINVNLFNTLHSKIENINTQLTHKSNKTFLDIRDVSGDNFTEKIKNAISECEQGGLIYIPEGVYHLDECIEIDKTISIKGSDGTFWGIGTIIKSSIIGSAFSVKSRGVSISNIYMENIRDKHQTIGIELDNVEHISACSFENVHVSKYDIGFKVYRCYLLDFMYCRAGDCNTGFYLNTESTTLTLRKCWSLQNGIGYHLKNIQYSLMENCACDACVNPYIIENCRALSLKSGGVEVSEDIPFSVVDSTITIEGYESYRNNKTLKDSVSIGKFTNSNVTILGCYENELSYSTDGLSCNNTFEFINSKAVIYGGKYRKGIKSDSLSNISGVMTKDGGQINFNTGDLGTLSTKSKTVVGGINELYEDLDSLKNGSSNNYIPDGGNFTGSVVVKCSGPIVFINTPLRANSQLEKDSTYDLITIDDVYRPNTEIQTTLYLGDYKFKIYIKNNGLISIMPYETIPSGAYLRMFMTFIR